MTPQQALALHHDALVIDTHADTPQRLLDEQWDLPHPLGRGMLNLDTARQGGLDAEFFAIWVDPAEYPGRFAHRALALADSVLQQVRRYPHTLRLCLTPDDILAARAENRFAVLLGLEGGHAIENSLALLRIFFTLGVRYMTLTWSNSNEWADSSGDLEDTVIAHHGGLTPFGRDVIREMNRLGMMVDVSHVADSTFADVLSTSTSPVIASHSSAHTVTPSHRNLTDDQLRAIASTGGVAMVNFYPPFIDEQFRQQWEATRSQRAAELDRVSAPYRSAGTPVPFSISDAVDRDFAHRIGLPPLESLIQHIDHMVAIAGIDHIGIGSDFDGIPAGPQGLETAAGLPLITQALAARGYDSSALRKILGENLLRTMRTIQAHAAAAS